MRQIAQILFTCNAIIASMTVVFRIRLAFAVLSRWWSVRSAKKAATGRAIIPATGHVGKSVLRSVLRHQNINRVAIAEVEPSTKQHASDDVLGVRKKTAAGKWEPATVEHRGIVSIVSEELRHEENTKALEANCTFPRLSDGEAQ